MARLLATNPVLAALRTTRTWGKRSATTLSLPSADALQRPLRDLTVGGHQVGDHPEGEDLYGRHPQHAAEDDRLQVAGPVAPADPVPEERHPRQRAEEGQRRGEDREHLQRLV